jgi:hypothetical protein
MFLQLTACAGMCGAAGYALEDKSSGQSVHKFHDSLPNGPLPKVADPEQFAKDPAIKRVYELASAIPTILYQLPCYCGCDKAFAHTSLLDCFTGTQTHAVHCLICRQETVFAFRKVHEGQKIVQIREAIIGGAWLTEDADDLSKLPMT